MIAIGPAGFNQAPAASTNEPPEGLSAEAFQMLRELVNLARTGKPKRLPALKRELLAQNPGMEKPIAEAIRYWALHPPTL